MTSKCDITEPLKNRPFALLLFKPSNETQIKPFKDIKVFLNNNPKEVGVISSRNYIFYLLPTCKQSLKYYP